MFLALNGSWTLRVAIGWVAWSMTGQASFVGFVAFLTLAPTILASPLFGVLADRIDLKRAAFTIQFLMAGVAAILGVAELAGLLGPALLSILALVFGLAMAAYHPVRLSLAPRLVPRDQIARAIPVISINFNLSRFIGPFVAGLLIGLFGPAAAFLAASAAVVPILVVLPRLHLREREDETRPRHPFIESLAEGFGVIRRSESIRLALLLTGLSAIPVRGVQEILPAIADGVFARGPEGLGQLTAAAGIGAVAASAWMIRHPVREGDGLPTRSVLAAWFGLVLVAALAHAPLWPIALTIVAAVGGAGTLTAVGIQSAIQMQLEDGIRGRVMSVWVVVAIGAMALGAVALGGLVDAFGLPVALGLTSVACALLLVVPTWRAGRLARRPV